MGPSISRRAFVGLCMVGVTGCTWYGGAGTATPAPDNPAFGEAAQMGDLGLTSPTFEDGGTIPRKYGRDAQNVNPPLRITGVPEPAASLALIMDDPDAVEPAGKVWVHWLVWNIDPTRTEIPAGWTPTEAIEGNNDFGATGYGGPDPPDTPHTYRFKLYALDTPVDLSAGATKTELGQAMERHIVARTQLEGTYAP